MYMYMLQFHLIHLNIKPFLYLGEDNHKDIYSDCLHHYFTYMYVYMNKSNHMMQRRVLMLHVYVHIQYTVCMYIKVFKHSTVAQGLASLRQLAIPSLYMYVHMHIVTTGGEAV